jgi:hypothetical protein
VGTTIAPHVEVM